MKMIATKSTSVGVLYMTIFIFVSGFLIGFGYLNPYVLFMGLLLFVVTLIIVIDYTKSPKTPIMVNKDNEIVLPRGILIKPEEITDVSYRRASGKGIQYRWGTVIITTNNHVYKYKYLKDCEEVSKVLTKLMYESKSML